MGQDKDPLADGEQQEAYRWVPCPRKTKIARRQTGLQRISRAVFNTQDKDDNKLGQVRPEVSWQPRRGRLYSMQPITAPSTPCSKSHDHQK